MHIKCRYFSRKNLATGGVEPPPPQMPLTVKVGPNVIHPSGKFLEKEEKNATKKENICNLPKRETFFFKIPYLNIRVRNVSPWPRRTTLIYYIR